MSLKTEIGVQTMIDLLGIYEKNWCDFFGSATEIEALRQSRRISELIQTALMEARAATETLDPMAQVMWDDKIPDQSA